MKKLLALLLTLALCLGMTSALAETVIVVQCWDPAFNLYAMEEAAKIYKEINPDVTIKIEEVASDDLETKQTTAFMSGDTSNLPDILLMQDNSGLKFLNTFPGSYAPLSDYVDLSDFAGYKKERFTYEGKAYAVPFDNGIAATFIRTDYLEAAGYTLADVTDITWDQFIEIGLKVKEATGNYMLSVQAGYADIISMMIESSGTWYFDAEGKPQLNTNPVIRKAIETTVKLRQSGVVKEGADWAEYISSFNNGTAAATINGCWIIGSVSLAADQAGKWGVANCPRLDVEGGTNYGSNGGSSWVVPASSKNIEIAADFLAKTFAGSVDFYQTILESAGAIATYLPAAGGEAYGREQSFFQGQKVFVDLMDYAGKLPAVKYGIYNYEARDALVKAVESIVGGEDLDAALQTAQEEVEFYMAE